MRNFSGLNACSVQGRLFAGHTRRAGCITADNSPLGHFCMVAACARRRSCVHFIPIIFYAQLSRAGEMSAMENGAASLFLFRLSFSAAAPSISKNIHYNSACSEGDEKQQKRKRCRKQRAHHSHAKALCSFAFAAQTDAPLLQLRLTLIL
jgi:hypothetical protein